MQKIKNRDFYFRAVFLIISAIFISALIFLSGRDSQGQSSASVREDFDEFVTSCFKEYVAQDSITLHFKLSDPSSYGISEEKEPSYGDLSLKKQQENSDRAAELLQELSAFPSEKLTQKQQLTWKVMKSSLSASASGKDYLLYSSMLGTNGLQSQIPVTLSEYSFRSEKDVQDYLALINQVPDLFSQIISFENERRQAGIVSPDFVITDTIEQIDQFLRGSEEDNLLIQSFNERIDEVESLSSDQKESYIANNHSLITQKVFPAFRSLKSSLEKYTDEEANGKERLCQYKDGKKYYRLLLAANTGTEMTPEECITALEKQLQSAAADVTSLTKKNPDLYTEYLSAAPALSDADSILEELKNDTLIDFPEIPDVTCHLKTLPDGLSTTSACAFYLVPPIDSENENIIYINNSRVDSNELFSTLAHESYPGHLYQTNYYLDTDPSPIRLLLGTDGYDEGWGTYAQLYSYQFLEFKDSDETATAQLRQLYLDNDLLSLSLSALSDLYVNYKNYDEAALAKFLKTYGIEEESAKTLYQYVIENPASYLSYSIGYYEFNLLKEDMEEELGDSFELKDFHEAVLNAGSCNFSILREEVEKTLLPSS